MRFIEICWVLSKYLLLHKFGRHRQEIFGVRLRRAFERLGIAFIKIGQIISMRYDLLNSEDRQALRSLLDDVNPIPFPEILRILNAEYNQPIESIFSKIEPLPLGSASVSQVHKAWLHDGSAVALKIKRPGVDRTFIRDVNFLKKLAAIGEVLVPKLRYVRAKELTAYFENWIRQDLDFGHELQNMQRIIEQQNFALKSFRADLGRQVFPKPFKELCTPNLLVMDFIDGIAINKKSDIMARPDYDLEKSVRTYIVAAIRSWFEADGETFYFQADPHFSNILALPGGDVAAIDQGLVAHLSKSQAELLKDLVFAVYLQDLAGVLEIAVKITETRRQVNLSDLESDFKIFLERAQRESFGFWFNDFVKVLVRHRRKIPLFIVSFGRAAVIIDSLAHEYLPGENTLDILDYEFKRAILISTARNLVKIDLKKMAQLLVRKINRVPVIFASVLQNPFGFAADLIRTVKEAVA